MIVGEIRKPQRVRQGLVGIVGILYSDCGVVIVLLGGIALVSSIGILSSDRLLKISFIVPLVWPSIRSAVSIALRIA